MKINNNLLLAAVCFATVCVLTATGQIDNLIPFQDETTALTFCLLSGVIALGAGTSAFERVD